MSAQTNTDQVRANPSAASRTYAELRVVDGERVLRPTHVAFDRLIFSEPPHLVSSRVRVIVTNGDQQGANVAIVLPHDADATRIPIELLAPR